MSGKNWIILYKIRLPKGRRSIENDRKILLNLTQNLQLFIQLRYSYASEKMQSNMGDFLFKIPDLRALYHLMI